MEVKRILVTGGAGFIGHHLLRRLLKHPEYEIISLDRLDFSGNLNRIAELAQEFGPEEMRRLRVIFHDLRAELNDQISKQIGELDYIVHMAAGSHVNRSIANPLQFVQDNVVGTANLLEFARHHQPNLKKFINFGTDEVFGDAPDDIEYTNGHVTIAVVHTQLLKQEQKSSALRMKIPTRCLSMLHTP